MIFKEWLLLEAIKDIRNMYKSLIDFLGESQENLYVNFSDRPRIDMKLSLKPSHHDPIGIYGFSKRHMLQEKRTNEGFWSLPYIYVFKLSEGAKVLNLSEISVNEAKDLLEKMEISDYIEKPYYRKLHGEKGGHLLWHTMEKYIATNNLSKNVTWNKLFAKAGNFDALLDDGDSIIHSNEPEQICVLNPKVINIVKTVESPMAEYAKKIWRKMYEIANSVGQKYFDKYLIKSKRTGRTEIARRYGGSKSSNFGTTNVFSISTISENPNVRYVFELRYDLNTGEVICELITPYGVNNKNFVTFCKKSFESQGYSSEYKLIDFTEWENVNKEVHAELDKLIKPSNADVMQTSVDLLNKITKIMRLPNVNIRTTLYPSFCAESTTQINLDRHAIKGNLIIKVCPDFSKKKTRIYINSKLQENIRISPSKISISNIELDQLPDEIDPEQIIINFKNNIEEMIENAEKHEMSYIYTSDVRYLRKILQNYFV